VRRRGYPGDYSKSVVIMDFYTLAYIHPIIFARDMVQPGKPLRATTSKLIRLLHLISRCSCGHNKEYHISGRYRCVFGICDCKKYVDHPIVATS
jgi:hypothetical protein